MSVEDRLMVKKTKRPKIIFSLTIPGTEGWERDRTRRDAEGWHQGPAEGGIM